MSVVIFRGGGAVRSNENLVLKYAVVKIQERPCYLCNMREEIHEQVMDERCSLLEREEAEEELVTRKTYDMDELEDGEKFVIVELTFELADTVVLDDGDEE